MVKVVKRTIEQNTKKKDVTLTMMFHSMEIVSGDGGLNPADERNQSASYRRIHGLITRLRLDCLAEFCLTARCICLDDGQPIINSPGESGDVPAGIQISVESDPILDAFELSGTSRSGTRSLSERQWRM
jgi:hypothetical protein